MFKLESYIAPILLSYVDKYIKNFRVEDSQVSLWGGDASFHNLDLRLEVLEQELQSPFSFISGHIRELLIHVPWTKLTSEPITITINTIECVLKLKDSSDDAGSDTSPTRDKHKKHNNKKQEVEAPPNYVQLLINKIVNNIRIYCNNLILKYVEEDIVLSMNVKHLKVESCNEKWETAYTDPSSRHVTMRKIIGLNDLTVCLDKRNSSGKIDFYQEPMLYRCSMTMHLLQTYSTTSSKTSLNRLDIYCNNMEFSVTEQQVPMFLRLMVLIAALQQRQLKSQIDISENSSSNLEHKDSDNNTLTWSGWAWSYVSSVLLTQWDENAESEMLTQSGPIVQIGFYVDNASLTFKIAETIDRKAYYQNKIRYNPLIALKIQGFYSEIVLVGRKWTNACSGVSEILLEPVGLCSCSFSEETPEAYLKIGFETVHHKSNSLFDVAALENSGQHRQYNTNWDFHVFTNTDQVLLERTPAFAFDFLYQMELPEDASSDILSELGSNLEYSNMAEKAAIRICFGSLKFRFTAGLYHRLSSLISSAESYDYSPYCVPKPEPNLSELLPPSSEDFDALNEFIPTRTIHIMIYEPVVELHFMDHPYFEASKGAICKKSKNQLISTIERRKMPKIVIDCKSIGVAMSGAMYMNRLVHTTCQLPDPPENMFKACFNRFDVHVVGLCGRLFLKENNQTIIVVPFNLNFSSRDILRPQYWVQPDVVHHEVCYEAENLTFNCTKAKLIVVSHLIDNILKQNLDGLNHLKYSSLLYDACRDNAMPYLELNIEGFKFRKVCTNSTVSLDLSLDSIKAFVFESNHDESNRKQNNIQQVLFLSGPETNTMKKMVSLLSITMQYPLKPDVQPHPSLLIFNMQEINVCVDPLVCKWFLYHPIEVSTMPKTNERGFLLKPKSFSADTLSTLSETQRKSSVQIESVHSSSDRDLHLSQQLQSLPRIIEEEPPEQIDLQEKIYNFLKNWHPVWKSIVLNGHIAQCIIYFPMASISAVGSQGVEQAIKEALDKKLVPNIMVISLPSANVRSAQKQNIQNHLKTLPIKLPNTVWSEEHSSFPWSLSIENLTCYSMEHKKQTKFVHTVDLSATVGLSTKAGNDTNAASSNIDFSTENSSSLGVYIHIDVTPIVISVSETQMYQLASLVYGLCDFFASLTPKKTVRDVIEMNPPLSSVLSVASGPVSLNTFENTSDTIPPPPPQFPLSQENGTESVKLTAWVQWTMTKVSVEFLTSLKNVEKSEVRLLVEIEDIVSSLDYQNVYLKLKSKIGAIAIGHYKNKGKKWVRGPFSGLVLRLREDISTPEKSAEDGGFFSLTLTRASCRHTHNLWGALLRSKDKKQMIQLHMSRFLTEIVVSIQPIDLIVSIETLIGFYSIIAPFLAASGEKVPDVVENEAKAWFTNENLPLAYLECNEIRLILPSSKLFSGIDKNKIDDVFIAQIGKISLSPSVTNPILRKPIRPDIYRQAVQNSMLTVPGSELEDRQYQIDIVSMSFSTTTWKDLEPLLTVKGGISENPALEWNNLKQGKKSIVPSLNLRPISEKIEICIVAAPMMLYKSETIICCSSFEVNFVTDIAVSLSTDQMRLFKSILNEIDLPPIVKSNHSSISFPYSRFESISDLDFGLNEFYKDSGIDTSEIRSNLSLKSNKEIVKKLIKATIQPLEVLFTAGKISLCLYESVYLAETKKKKRQMKSEENYEASEEEEESAIDSTSPKKRNIPLVYFLISQPNAYASTQKFMNRAHISCFDFAIKLNSMNSRGIYTIPLIDDFSIDLIETRAGYPDPNTGIFNTFFTLKYLKEYGKNATYHMEMGKPTRIDCSTKKLQTILGIQSKLNDIFAIKTDLKDRAQQKSSFRATKDYLREIETIQFKSEQLSLLFEGATGTKICLTIDKIKHRLFGQERPEKITNRVKFEMITLSIQHESFQRLILNPWTISIELNSFLEPWQSEECLAQRHILIDSESILIDVSPEHIYHLRQLIEEIEKFGANFSINTAHPEHVEAEPTNPDQHQHYKDDLRAGVFQFIDASDSMADELPLPYQVMFWNYKELSAMAWRYPQPRALTKVRIFPVPLEITRDTSNNRVNCQLQYWSDYRASYVNYAEFNLSESEVYYLDLPKNEPERDVAHVWRVKITTFDVNDEKVDNLISARALAICMRIDSYFNKKIVPNQTISVNLAEIGLSLHTNFYSEGPFMLDQFSCDWLLPECHCFSRLSLDKIKIHVANWRNAAFYIDFETTSKCSIIDYNFLKEKILFDQFQIKVEANLAEKIQLNVVTKPIEINFSPSVTHTLAVNAQLWGEHLNKVEKPKNSVIIFTKYVICNDTNVNIRFGQADTDEDIFLKSRNFHMYAWRSIKSSAKLKVALEAHAWTWSLPFRIDQDGGQTVAINAETNLNIRIKSLSSTQKQIIITGQFVIANMLLEHFEFKVFEVKKVDAKKVPVHVLAGKTITPSMFLDRKKVYFFRLRFFGLDSAWTGDIPLKEHTKGAQPWLVKVPLQERGQFLSIWCRIVVEECEAKEKRILAMLWPLFMVKSSLPVVSKIHIETPTLNVRLDSVVKGNGERQQLYCPGTIDHSHQLTFKLHDGTSISDPYIPLNYSLVDQQKFFKRQEKENIDEIIASLRTFDKAKWPNFGDEHLDSIVWKVQDQPQTTIQVRYQNACLYSSALMVELLPWCLMVNTFGCPISLMSNGVELCRLAQYGIVAPPKLNGNFHLGVDIGEGMSYSSALQLATSDWSQTFYMPKISGTLPMDGSVKVAVKCDNIISMVSVSSALSDEIRLLKVSSTHVFTNCLSHKVHVLCMALPEGGRVYDIPTKTENLSFLVAPSEKNQKTGLSIIRWFAIENNADLLNNNYSLYITFSCDPRNGWSCPLKVDDGFGRKSFSLSGYRESVPVVLTLEELKGTVYLTLHHDNSPQTLIKNNTSVCLYCAQALGDASDQVVKESTNFNWVRKLGIDQCVHYTMPFIAEKFPELPQTCFSEKIVFGYGKETAKFGDIVWSSPISITNDLEKFIKIPKCEDVRLVVKITAYTTIICLEAMNQVEVSAIDIRGRLSRHEKGLQMPKNDPDLNKSYYIEPSKILEIQSQLSLYKSLFTPTLSIYNRWENIQVTFFMKSFSLVFLDEMELDVEREGIACFTFDGVVIELKQFVHLETRVSIADVQFDNQAYLKGAYDFPVVLVSQENKSNHKIQNIFQVPSKELIKKSKDNALVCVNLIIETWMDTIRQTSVTGVKEVRMKLNPLSIYIEDLYINKLLQFFNSLLPTRALLSTQTPIQPPLLPQSLSSSIPEEIYWQSIAIAKPLNLKTITIEPLSLLLSVHSSLKMYIALDQSPLQFTRFERRRVLTTPYRLGHAMTMHYLSGAIFGAGWVVSSLELLGSPSGLARAMGIGLRDFVRLPYYGLVRGPFGFLSGVTNGSASLMKHVTAGTLQSVTKLASSVARNLDRLTLDDEHLKRTEEQRRQKPQGVTQGFMQGLTGLGISLLGAVGGIAHHPLQSLMSDRASPRSLAAGVGLGLVGVLTKPLSGAAELVALTGQGLLQGAGWNPLPQPRFALLNLYPCDGNSNLKFEWKLLSSCTLRYKCVLFASDATMVQDANQMMGVVLALTKKALFLLNLDGDLVLRVVALDECFVKISDVDPTLLLVRICKQVMVAERGEVVEGVEEHVEMDEAARARVADYVKSTASLLQLRDDGVNGGGYEDDDDENVEVLRFYVNPGVRSGFTCWLALAKQKSNNYTFSVLQ